MKHQIFPRILSVFLILMLAVAVMPVTPVRAAILNVTSTGDTLNNGDGVCTLREAITNANADANTWTNCGAGTGVDTITFSGAATTITLTSALPTITDGDGLTINGGSAVTISGGGAFRIFNITSGATTVQNITLTNGQVDGNGGAILNNGGTGLTVSNVTFTTNRTVTTGGNDGGAIYHTSGALSISNSAFTGNYTLDNGGAIYIANGAGTMTISGSSFNTQNNAAIDDGAAIYLNNGILAISGSTTFTSNATSNGGGGAIFQNAGTLTINGATFTSNAVSGGGAGNSGGAIFQNGGALTIGNTAAVTFTGNTANADGGAIHVAVGILTVNNTAFTNSTAANSADNGGAIYHNSGTLLTVTNSTFTGNTSTNGDGGAIMMDANASSAAISGSTFTSNSAEDDAGAIFTDGEPFTVTSSVFTSNSAGTGAGGGADGGAIRITNNSVSATSKITLSAFVNNSISMAANQILHGGAIANEGTVIIANVAFSGNSLTKSTNGTGDALGGAIYSSGTTTVHNVTLSGNTISESGLGTGSGGTIYSAGGAITIANSIVANGTENGAAGNCGGTITNGGNNIDYLGGDCGFAITTNPNLGALTSSPQYFPLGLGSSAIDTGSNAICATGTTTNNQSQNGLSRPLDGNGDATLTCDIGSYESPTMVVTSLSVSPASGTYGGTTTLTATLSPAVSGKTINFTLNGVSAGSAVTNAGGIASIPAASLAGINAGTYLGGAGSGVGASFAGDVGYSASSGTATLTVNKADAAIVVSGYTGPYDGAAHGATGSATGVLGESLSGLDLGATFTNVPGGAANWTFTDVTGNYNDDSGSVAIVITKADAVIIVNGYTGAYDGSPHGATGSVTGVLGESLSGLDLGATFTNVPGGAANWTFIDVTGNYNDDSGSVAIVINETGATIVVTPYSVVYDGAPHTATGFATGILGESLSGLDLSATTHTNAGVYNGDPWIFTDVTGNYNNDNGAVNNVITAAPATVTLGNLSHTYDGAPKSATATTNPLSLAVSITYNGSPTAPSNAGSYSVNATITDPNYSGSATGTLNITQATVIPNITADDKVYDGNATAAFTCSLTVVFGFDDVTCSGGTASFADKNVGAGKKVDAIGLGLTGADAANYLLDPTTASDTADITARPLTVTATGVDKIYDGTTTATVNLSDDRLSGDNLTLTYSSADFVDPNVGVNITINVSGISISGGTDAGNYALGNATAVTSANIGNDSQVITVNTSAPATAANGAAFDVAATASSGLPVTITTSGVCTGSDTDGTATITMTSGAGTCSVFYDQAGDGNYLPAPQVQEDVTATEGPSFTSADNTSFDMGFFGTFTVTAVGNPSTMTIALTGGSLPDGVTLTDNGDGTAILQGTPAAGTNGTYNLVFTADNDVLPNGTQNFTLTIRNGPTIGADGINSIPETSGGGIIENESILDTLGITRLLVEFSQDVYNPAGDTDPDDVTNPANYMLVRTPDGIFSTVSCAGGVVAPDVSISIDSVTYSNGGGAGPYIATVAVNGGFPLNVVGFHRLYVCGTTSIVDANNTNLVLAGNGTNPATDFQRNFRIVVQGGGGGGGGGGSENGNQIAGNFLIPVTGFAPHQTTPLPAQPADKVYKLMGGMTLEIPSLVIKYPIVGAPITNKTWDLTWLQNSVAYLEGSAYPTLAGNTVLTAHVLNASNNPGPFSEIKNMQVGQKIYIHVNRQTYVYQVQQNQKILPTSISKAFKHEEDSWITLVTCEDFNAKTGLYSTRRMVRAVLISVIPSKK